MALFYRTRGEIDKQFGKVDLNINGVRSDVEKVRLSVEKDIALLNLNLEERQADYLDVRGMIQDHEDRIRKLESK